MSNLTEEQRVNCMKVAAYPLNQDHYITRYQCSIRKLIADDAKNFPNLFALKDDIESDAFKAEFLRTFGFNEYYWAEWMALIRAKIDFEKIGTGRMMVSPDMISRQVQEKPRLMERFKSFFDFGMDP